MQADKHHHLFALKKPVSQALSLETCDILYLKNIFYVYALK